MDRQPRVAAGLQDDAVVAPLDEEAARNIEPADVAGMVPVIFADLGGRLRHLEIALADQRAARTVKAEGIGEATRAGHIFKFFAGEVVRLAAGAGLAAALAIAACARSHSIRALAPMASSPWASVRAMNSWRPASPTATRWTSASTSPTTRAGTSRFSGSVYDTWRNQAGTNDADVNDRFHDYAMLAVQGPKAREIVGSMAELAHLANDVITAEEANRNL